VTPNEFVRKWRKVELTERSACQQHFLDLCELVGHPKPAEADPTGVEFCFERGAEKLGGGDGWADVWKRGFFAFEYKGRHKDLSKAYQQLALYRESLENPPLLVVCDMDRIEVHTNFTGTAKRIYVITLENFTETSSIEVLRNVFFHPEKLRPGTTSEAITADAASKMAQIAIRMAKTKTDIDSHSVARFLDRIVFCMFAEDIELLPAGLFTKVVKNSRGQPDRFAAMAKELFATMAKGGNFGFDVVPYFNGNLFDETPVLSLNEDEIEMVYQASILDWSAIDPSIFGTLFERGLDPDKRSMLGAHYTSRSDIETLVDPVVMAPLLHEWEAVRLKIEPLIEKGGKIPRKKADALAHRFLEDLGKIRVLDPACGSGNFLYVALQKIKNLERDVNAYLNSVGLPSYLPIVGPWQFFGIEINPYAAELAQMTLWIGYLQWTRANGYGIQDSPVLRKLDNITCDDSVMRLGTAGEPYEPEWPEADFIIGNPPFIGGKMLKRQLGSKYVDTLFTLYKDKVAAEADFCCYWFEKSRCAIEKGRARRAGLLATQGIRGGANREVLRKISESGGIFFAVSDRDWIIDGATVHISMVGFDNGSTKDLVLDGAPVDKINVDLTSSTDVTSAKIIPGNGGMVFMGITPAGPFDITESVAVEWLQSPNANGRPNSDVLRPYLNGKDINNRPAGRWTIDFHGKTEDQACLYEAPFHYALSEIKPVRADNNREAYRENWWLYAESRSGMRAAFRRKIRFLCTCRVAKHRLFAWVDTNTLHDSATFGFARDDDFFMGVLQSKFHVLWAQCQGTQLREEESGSRYTPTTCFETFPLPRPTPSQAKAVAAASKELSSLREQWLNPPEWTSTRILEFPGTTTGPWERFIDLKTVDAKTNIGLVRYPHTMPKDNDSAAKLRKRTLTNLYNEQPTWLDKAHKAINIAVADAYGWPTEVTDEQIIDRLLNLNQSSG
jgi:hypothetical protein